MTLDEILKSAGPFTAPLCGAMGFALRWLVNDRSKLVDDLTASQERERKLSEKRSQELLESTKALGESAHVVDKALSEHDKRLDRMMQLWESSTK